MKRLSFLLAALLALGFVCGCSGGGGPVQLENVCDEMQDALCDYIKKCDLDFYLKFAAKSTCDQLFSCDEMNIAEMTKAVDAGRMAYDADLAGTCLQKMRNAKCALFDDMFEELGEDCDKVFSGLVAVEGDCYQGNECAEGLYCDESVSECPGNCQAYKDIGQSCNGGDCNPDVADCDYQQGVCAALAGVGQICDYVECEEGLVCDYDVDPAVCLNPAGDGGSCTSNHGCQTGLQCVDGTCIGPAGAGQECDVGAEFEYFMFACAPNYYCDADVTTNQRIGKCQSKKGSGSECILFYECKSGLLCIGMTIDEQTEQVIPGACGTPLKAGAACNAQFEFPECDWDLYCEPQPDQTGKCTAYPGIGDPCVQQQDPECFGDDLYCDGALGTCQQKKPAGSDCTNSDECQDGWCNIGGTDKCEGYEDCVAP
jgi:hypothetical protein